jgi:membrane associated rhomboid family serine protease
VARHNPLAALPKFTQGAFGVFAVTLLLTMILADQPVANQLLLQPGGFIRGEGLWQPLSANFIFEDGRVALVFGTLAVQWFLGSELEKFWGTRRYLALILGCGFAGYLVTALSAFMLPAVAQVTVGGSTAMDLATVTAFGAVFGKRPLRLLGALPLTSRSLAILIVALSLISPIARGAPWPVVLPWLVAIAGALAVTTQPWRTMRDSGKIRGSKRKRRKADHLRVVRPDRDLLN